MRNRNLIVKDNALIEASHKLNEVEQRLILLAILKARGYCNSVEQLKGKELVIHADDYVKTFNVSRQNAYIVLKKAVVTLFRAEWGYKFVNTKGSIQVAYRRFIQSADYVDNGAIVQFKFSDDIIPMLVELEKRFTMYEIEQVAGLKSRYAMRLYELFMQHFDKKTEQGWLKISLDDLRFRLGLLENEYLLMSDFKKRVLDLSISQMNAHTDLEISYTQQKQGRIITGFSFEFKKKPQVKSQSKKKEPTKKHIIIETKMAEHIKRLESKGETVCEWHKENISKKAVAERWGLEDLEAKIAKERTRQEQLAKKLLQQQAQKEMKKQEKEEFEQKYQLLKYYFESLEPEQQEKVLDEVEERISNRKIHLDTFKRKRQENKVYEHPMFINYFYEVLKL